MPGKTEKKVLPLESDLPRYKSDDAEYVKRQRREGLTLTRFDDPLRAENSREMLGKLRE